MFYWSRFILTCSYTRLVDTSLELHVYSTAFDQECAAYSRSKSSDTSDTDDSYGLGSLWDANSDTSTVEVSPYDVSIIEAYLYYFGLRGIKRRGPKLIFRTSKDIFKEPSGPGQDVRRMQLLPVYEEHHDKLGKNDLWDIIRSKVVQLLCEQNIKLSSVDLARFCWFDDEDENVDTSEDEDDREDLGNEETMEVDINEEIAPYGKLITTPVTIWIGVSPDSLSCERAHHSSQAILTLLKEEYGIADVDIAYRESTVKFSSGPELFAPVSDLDPLKNVIDSVTTALGLPIAGLKSLKSQGTLGFYFRVDEVLYGVTARHVLFSEHEANDEYRYVPSAPKKEVVVMGSKAYTNLLRSIQSHIGILDGTASVLEKRITSYKMRLEKDPNAEQVTRDLGVTERQLNDMRNTIEALKKFFVKMKKEWEKPKDRVIGHVVWAPPISVNNEPYGYTKDVCVIKLNEKKFLRNFKKNVLDLGTEIESGKFINLMYARDDAQSDFDYPPDRLLKLQGVLSADEIRKPNNKNVRGDSMRYVIKRGLTTLTTIGCLTGFKSFVRRYSLLGPLDSIEAAIYPYDNESGPFSRGGDSGAIIVDALGKFVALLLGGTGHTDSFDVTYGSPMHWLWEIIKAEFSGANLYWDDDAN